MVESRRVSARASLRAACRPTTGAGGAAHRCRSTCLRRGSSGLSFSLRGR
nr:MAG TPA: hypothetical protein [Caudoviricetes sp.]